jgi:hypothetical protein
MFLIQKRGCGSGYLLPAGLAVAGFWVEAGLEAPPLAPFQLAEDDFDFIWVLLCPSRSLLADIRVGSFHKREKRI